VGAVFSKKKLTAKYMGIGTYLKETQSELKHVSWLSRRQTIIYTAVVIAISLGVAIYSGALDYVFSQGLSFLLTHF
jgi:preprotein translocase SecE subunit